MRLHIAVYISALEAIHFGDMIEPYAVGVAVDEEHRSFGGFEFIGAEIEWSHSRCFEVIKKIRESVRVGV